MTLNVLEFGALGFTTPYKDIILIFRTQVLEPGKIVKFIFAGGICVIGYMVDVNLLVQISPSSCPVPYTCAWYRSPDNSSQ